MDQHPDNERLAFQAMRPEEQVLSLFDMLRFTRAEIASTRRAVLDLQTDITHYRSVREVSEKQSGLMTTSQKIRAVMNERFDTGAWFRDRVLPQVMTIIVIALLYLVFQKP